MRTLFTINVIAFLIFTVINVDAQDSTKVAQKFRVGFNINLGIVNKNVDDINSKIIETSKDAPTLSSTNLNFGGAILLGSINRPAFFDIGFNYSSQNIASNNTQKSTAKIPSSKLKTISIEANVDQAILKRRSKTLLTAVGLGFTNFNISYTYYELLSAEYNYYANVRLEYDFFITEQKRKLGAGIHGGYRIPINKTTGSSSYDPPTVNAGGYYFGVNFTFF